MYTLTFCQQDPMSPCSLRHQDHVQLMRLCWQEVNAAATILNLTSPTATHPCLHAPQQGHRSTLPLPARPQLCITKSNLSHHPHSYLAGPQCSSCTLAHTTTT